MAATLLPLGYCQSAQAVTYTSADTFLVSTGYSGTQAYGIAGTQIVGTQIVSGGQALLWTDTSSAVVLTPTNLSGFSGSDAYATNGAHQVGDGTGTAAGGSGGTHAMLWSGASSTAVDLNPTNLSGITISTAIGIAGNQEVGVGRGTGTGNNDHAILWTGAANTAVDLNPTNLTGYTASFAYATDGSQQVGYASGSATSGNNHAMLWSGTASSAVDLQPTDLTGFVSSSADGISGTQIVGVAQTPGTSDNTYAILWTSASPTSAVDLNPLPQGQNVWLSQATATNGAEQVGLAFESHGNGIGNPMAVVWSGTASSMINLDALLPSGEQGQGTVAQSIDAYGNIVGFSLTGAPPIWLAGDTYKISGGTGTWNTATNWLSGIPAAGNDVLLIQSDTSNRTITYASTSTPLLGNVTIDATGSGSITLAQSINTLNAVNEYLGFVGIGNYIQSGGTNHVTNTLTLGAKAGSSGSYILDGPGVLTAGAMTINSGTFEQAGGTCTVGSFVNNGAFSQAGGTASLGQVTGTGSLSIAGTVIVASIVQNSLTISGDVSFLAERTSSTVNSLIIGGKLDLADNLLIVNYTAPDPARTIKSLLASGYNNGKWNATSGIVSSSAAANSGNYTTLGYYDTGSQVKIKYTWVGDANLDGVVDNSDLLAMSSTGTNWQTGDFNYDGKVNSDDYSLFMLGASESGGANISQSLPEPAVGVILGSLFLFYRRR
ncbi:MAG TPA: dockerin type I repeat-containing protein [Tepidisphaeraceae bacterium]